MILSAYLRALGQMFDPRFRRVLWIGVALSIALLVVFYSLFLWYLQGIDEWALELPVIGPVTWIGDLLGWASMFLMLFFSMFLMIPVASAITSLFLDDVAQAVEDEYYPHLPPVGRVGFVAGVIETVSFLGLLLIANIAALFLYMLFPVATPLIFYAVNGYMLGWEYFQIAALRRLDRPAMKELRQRHRGKIWLAGILMTFLLSIPLANLLVPVLGAAVFTHIFHGVTGNPPRRA